MEENENQIERERNKVCVCVEINCVCVSVCCFFRLYMTACMFVCLSLYICWWRCVIDREEMFVRH